MSAKPSHIYAPISSDLTTNPPALLSYGTITSIDISPVSPLIYYVGTDDAQVWRSRDAGASWENISAGLPVRYVTRVTADPVDSMVVYVTHSGPNSEVTVYTATRQDPVPDYLTTVEVGDNPFGLAFVP